MAVYAYKGLDATGREISGVVDADAPRLARIKLKKEGIFPTQVSVPKEAETVLSRPVTSFFDRVTLMETALSTRQWATLLKAGIPLVEALTALIQQSDKVIVQKLWTHVREGVQEGLSVAEALGRHPEVFSSLYCQMVRAGEASGTLDHVLLQLADYYENRVRLRRKLTSILAYPILMTVASLAILLFLISFVVPRVTVVFSDMGKALPMPTVILLAVSDLLRNYSVALIVIAVIVGIALQQWLKTETGTAWYDRIILKVPLVGPVVKMMAVSRFTSTLATLLHSGVRLLPALEMVGQVVGNKVLEGAIQDARENIREGESIAEPMKRSGVFPPLVTHMVAIGERGGTLEEMLRRVSELYNSRAEETITGLTSLLTPLLTLGMGGVVLFIVLAILLPIFEISQIVG